MAEAVGVALGALALLSAFKDCIDLFSTISAAKSLGVDCEILNTKLDIEKTLLLQWIDRVRLLDPSDYDRRLDDLRINKAVSSILTSIRLLLSDSANLQNRYGMKPVERETAIIPTISWPRMNQFMQELENLSLRYHASLWSWPIKQRFYWVVRNKEKFSGFVQQLSSFVSKLNAVIPAIQEPVDVMTRKDLESIQNLRQVQLVLEAAKKHETGVADLAQKNISQRCQERVLERLWYRMIDERKNNVAEAHFKILQWALHPPTPEVDWDDLSEWLRSGSGIYWVSGKAGSGKSTLMKYLYQHPEIQTLLETWVPGRRLVMANFFFWHHGTPEQKTHEGLSRGLLYHVLEADHSLIPRILPTMWREAHDAGKANLELPSPGEIAEAFSKLKSEITKDKFCFFIDGLDEYAGNPMTGIAFINSLASSGNIKVLVSSRPTPAWVQAFSSRPKVQLQDLTRDDIKTYVDDAIGSHPHVQDLMTMEPQIIQRILEDLVDKASGVFLWVVLACRSLLEGFAAFDSPNELQQRVDELPPELDSLFKHMLNKIEPRYQVQAAKLLRICYQRKAYPEVEPHTRIGSPLSVCISEGIYTLGLALVDEHDLDMRRVPSLRPLSLEEKRMRCKMLEARMRSRYCGLLEVHRSKGRNYRCFCGHISMPTGRSFRTGTDRYRNATTINGPVDGLVDSMFGDSGAFKSQMTTFDANGVLSRMNLYLAYVSTTDGPVKTTQVNELTREALLCAKYADEAFSEATASILYSFSQMTFDLIKSLCKEVGFADDFPFFAEVKKHVRPSEKANGQLASVLAVELGMVNMAEHMGTLGILSYTQKTPLLSHAIDRPFSSWLPSFGLDVSPDMVALLLSKGFDPNMTFTGSSCAQTTPWKCWLLYMQYSFDLRSASIAAEVTELFLKASADVDVQVPGIV
ncbi:hypothetical protein EPUS_08668 [Endocarpon pusillum Z07020]|uniref:Uncharacterized protein n=1 Tax=Endocarpon pusillum (strain Z07020 / HMAS-L-300199) TaxID=1263415 RepID=U1G977_ENDPU|nr:uncharacterized protein EPUS_08668 [Endocarpon pusillum Z07020]ERF68231.1 hypothetical protein EPUS_08668 [Endocarpon pusillum Z07020]